MDEIIQYFGSKAELARALGVDAAAVSYWLREGLPPARAIEIEQITDREFLAIEIVGLRGDRDAA